MKSSLKARILGLCVFEKEVKEEDGFTAMQKRVKRIGKINGLEGRRKRREVLESEGAECGEGKVGLGVLASKWKMRRSPKMRVYGKGHKVSKISDRNQILRRSARVRS